MTDITDAGPRLKAMNDRLDELRAAADQADAEYREEIDRLRLTAEEREAVEWYAAYGAGDHAATLRGLLARLSPVAT